MKMNISIFGLGYVGSVSIGCLAKFRHKLIGVDINKKKVDLINNAQSAILEPGLNELISSGVKRKAISATQDYKYAVKNTDITFVCIGTPGKKDGSLNLNSLFNSLKQIAEGLKCKNSYHTIVIRSTIHPGSYNKIVNILERYSGKKKIKDFCVIINPEFLREGSAVNDFFNPPINIIGTECTKGIVLLKKIYSNNKAPIEIVSEETAEMVKLVSNLYHSVKISFANEVGNLCKMLGIDSNEIMRLFSKDKKLNISSAYLKPGFAFGGSCLPKDIKAIKNIARNNRLKIPLITGAMLTNDYQIKRTFDLITSFGEKKISIWGLSFKIGTDDMRESPIIKIINMLFSKGYDVKVYDYNIDINKIIGSNKEYVRKNFKCINDVLLKDFSKLLNHSNILIVNSYDKKLIKEIKKNNNKIILDLVNIPELKIMKEYNGICW